jgi:hypothetical protein
MVAVKRSVFVQLLNTVPFFFLKTTWELWKSSFFSFHFPSVTINQCAPNKEVFGLVSLPFFLGPHHHIHCNLPISEPTHLNLEDGGSMYPKNISAHKSTQSHNVEDCSLKRYS